MCQILQARLSVKKGMISGALSCTLRVRLHEGVRAQDTWGPKHPFMDLTFELDIQPKFKVRDKIWWESGAA